MPSFAAMVIMVSTSTPASRSCGQVVHERAVDLDHARPQPAQPPERRVAGAEIVDRKPQALGVDLGEHRLEVGDVGHRGLLGDLDHDPVGARGRTTR